MAIWQKEVDYDRGIKMLLFLISPFFAFLYALRSIKTKSSYWVFFSFCLFFGLSFSVTSGKTEENRGDGASYREKFEQFSYVTEADYYSALKEYLAFDEGKKDYYFETVAFYVSRVTDNYHVMFMVFAIVFAWFGLKSLKFLTAEDKFDASWASLILVYLFMINQIFNINGVRFWTAAWVGVYCILQIFRNNNRIYFLLLLCTPFFHGSFWLFVGVVTLAYFLRKSHKVLIPFFFVSFLVSNISVDFVRGLIDSLPPFIAGMANSYTSDESLEEQARGGSGFFWVAEFFRFAVGVYMNYLVYLFVRNAGLISANPKTKMLFSFLLLYMTFVNFTMPIPSLGGRFVMLAYPVIAYIWLVNFKGVKYQRVLFAMPFIFAMSVLNQFKLYTTVLEPTFYFSNPLYLIYKYLF